jgi:hypothetical protein
MSTISKQINDNNIRTGTVNRFRVTDTTRHTHTNINSPTTIQPTLFYVGQVLFNSVTSTFSAGSPFPKGFTVTTVNTGPAEGVEIVHNIGNNKKYVAFITPYWANNTSYSPEIIKNPNYLNVVMTNGGSNVAVSFDFLIIIINNTTSSEPNYF